MDENELDSLPSEGPQVAKYGRRRVLEALAVVGGALATSAFVPKSWAKPVIEMGVVPQQAVTSPECPTGDLLVSLTWDTDDTDLDLFVIEPSGFVVYPGDDEGPTAELDVDDTDGYGPENIYVPPGEAAAGVYKVYVGYYDAPGDPGDVVTNATIHITTFDNTPQKQTRTYTRRLEDYNSNDPLYAVAEITFPGGTIVEKTGTIPDPTALAGSHSKH